jgi:hypothetical protein
MLSGEGRTPGRLAPSPNVVSSRLGEGAVLVQLETNQIFELNTTGLRAWELIAEGLDLDAVIDRLGREFDVDEGRVRAEVTDLVAALVQQGLLDDRRGG